MTAMDIIGQRFRSVEGGGWGVDRHLEVGNQSELSDSSWLASHDGGGGAPVPSALAGPMETAARPALEAVERLTQEGVRAKSINLASSAQRSGPNRVEGKEKEQKQKRQSKEDRAPRVSNDNGPGRGWLPGSDWRHPARRWAVHRQIESRSRRATRMGQPLGSSWPLASLPSKGCPKLWEDDQFEMASVASPRSQIKISVLTLPSKSAVSW